MHFQIIPGVKCMWTFQLPFFARITRIFFREMRYWTEYLIKPDVNIVLYFLWHTRWFNVVTSFPRRRDIQFLNQIMPLEVQTHTVTSGARLYVCDWEETVSHHQKRKKRNDEMKGAFNTWIVTRTFTSGQWPARLVFVLKDNNRKTGDNSCLISRWW